MSNKNNARNANKTPAQSRLSYLELQALHLARHVHHLVERRRDETTETNDVDLFGTRGLEDLRAPRMGD